MITLGDLCCRLSLSVWCNRFGICLPHMLPHSRLCCNWSQTQGTKQGSFTSRALWLDNGVPVWERKDQVRIISLFSGTHFYQWHLTVCFLTLENKWALTEQITLKKIKHRHTHAWAHTLGRWNRQAEKHIHTQTDRLANTHIPPFI